LAEIPDNPIFMAVHVALLDWLIAARPTVPQDVLHSHNNVSYQQHIEIYDAIKAHDPDAADSALKVHLKSVFASYYPTARKRNSKK
jgi:DNA-binding FadR family transcriptional regulator